MPKVFFVGGLEDGRWSSFAQHAQEFGLPRPIPVALKTIALQAEAWLHTLPMGSFVRLDTFGRQFDSLLPFYHLGQRPRQAESDASLSPTEISALEDHYYHGAILAPRQLALGFADFLTRLAQANRPDIVFLQDPLEIITLCDKTACHQRLRAAGVPTAQALPSVVLPQILTYDMLRQQMATQGWQNAFVKLRHGSSASGIMALRLSQDRVAAWTTIAAKRGTERPSFFYNSRKIHKLYDHASIATLIHGLAKEGLHSERWFPKASLEGHSCDLRIVTVAGRFAAAVLRQSKTPFTNLHLGNKRADPASLRAVMTAKAWDHLQDTVTAVAKLFPKSLHLGIDLAVHSNFRNHAVLEVNAFGDFIKGTSWCESPYAAQMRWLKAQR